MAPGVEDLVRAGVAALRAVVAASGVEPEDVERHVASMLAFVRRRVTGDYEVDDFGFDEDFTEHVYLPLLRPLYRSGSGSRCAASRTSRPRVAAWSSPTTPARSPWTR